MTKIKAIVEKFSSRRSKRKRIPCIFPDSLCNVVIILLGIFAVSFTNQSHIDLQERQQSDFMNAEVILSENFGGPLYYLGNRNLSLPDFSGHMFIDKSWLQEQFSIILANLHGKKFKRCYEPFSGCASWSLTAMELGIAQEYVINDSDKVLINVLRLIKDNPEKIKASYQSLVKRYGNSNSKQDFFLKIIDDYNQADLEERSLLLPFIINHSWSGIVFHDERGDIVYRETEVQGKIVPGYLDEASLSVDAFLDEIDRVSRLLRNNQVTFKSGDFLEAISDIQSDDFVALNPPYPENIRARQGQSGMYVELYDYNILHEKIVNTVQLMEEEGIKYYMTYGFHDPEMKNFVIHYNSGNPRHFFRVLGYDNCVFGIGLDQVYYSPQISIPNHLNSKIIHASDVLQGRELSAEEALAKFNRVAEERRAS